MNKYYLAREKRTGLESQVMTLKGWSWGKERNPKLCHWEQ